MAPLYSPDSRYSYPGKQPQESRQQATEGGHIGLPEEEEEDHDDLPSLVYCVDNHYSLRAGLG